MLPTSFLNNAHLILQPNPQLFHFAYSYFGFTACTCGKSCLFSLHQEAWGVTEVTYIDKPYEISHQKEKKNIGFYGIMLISQVKKKTTTQNIELINQ